MTGVRGVVLPYRELGRVCLYTLCFAYHVFALACSCLPWLALLYLAIAWCATFLQGEDLCGPAEVLRSAGVNGSDFLAWKSEGELASDLRLPPFAARKLLACRARFLAAA